LQNYFKLNWNHADWNRHEYELHAVSASRTQRTHEAQARRDLKKRVDENQQVETVSKRFHRYCIIRVFSLGDWEHRRA
jgi:hypothetical protein